MTAADRPTVTDNARAEAMRRYPSDIADRGLTYPTGAVREHSRAAFVAGAEWAAGRAETTTVTNEDAAQVIERAAEVLVRDLTYSTGWDAEANDAIARTQAEALAESGLLATARTRPTREQIDRAVGEVLLAYGEVLLNAANHPDPVAVLGRSIAPLRTKITHAVLDLLRDGAR